MRERRNERKKNRKNIKIAGAVLLLAIAAVFVVPTIIQSGSDNPKSQAGEGAEQQNQEAEPPRELSPEEKLQLRAEEIAGTMTLHEKIGQMFMVAPEALNFAVSEEFTEAAEYGTSTDFNAAMGGALAKYPAGGIILFSNNISSPDQLRTFIGDMKNASKVPLFMAVDEEGGKVARVANTVGFDVAKFKSAGVIGKTGDAQQAKDMGSAIGKYLKEFGFNLDFAPVADINTNPNNVVIGNRAFGSDAELVSTMVNAAIDGFHAENMMTCIKHYPGHGDTKGDTHKGYVSVEKTWEELLAAEMVPFKNAIDKTDMVMVAHITCPNIASDGLPASLSKEMIQDRLRGQLGYDGVVITDSMVMGAIAKNYTSAESAVHAVNAGVDIVLLPEDYVEAFEGVEKAVQEGQIPEKRIDESVIRIIKLKIENGLLQ